MITLTTKKTMPKKQISSMSRPEMLLRQQQQDKESGWEFLPMSRARFEGFGDITGGGTYEVVWDGEQGGVWARKHKRTTPCKREVDRGEYRRPHTRFSDVCNGISSIFRGLERIDQATGGDLARSLDDLLG